MIRSWTIILCFLFMQYSAQDKQASSLTLTVSDIENDNGVIRILLFNDADGFPDQPEKAFKSATAPIRKQRAEIHFEDVPKGTYAFSVFHDSRNTGKLRTNVLGIPKDGYGFSNNTTGTFGPPTFDKAAFKVEKDTRVNISFK